MEHVPPPLSTTPRPGAVAAGAGSGSGIGVGGRRSIPYPTSPRDPPQSPFKPTSSLRHRRQSSSTVMSGGLTMSPGSMYEMETEGHRYTSLWSRDVEAASRNLGNAVSSGGGGGGGGGGAMGQDSDDEGLGKISQAMTLLSLHRGQNDADSHGQSSTATTPRSANIPPSWPDPEELLKESLRQSLSALHALGRIKALSGRLPADEEIDTGGEIAQIMGIYDRAIGEMRAAGEVLDLAQQYLAREKEVVLEQLLKG